MLYFLKACSAPHYARVTVVEMQIEAVLLQLWLDLFYMQLCSCCLEHVASAKGQLHNSYKNILTFMLII